jgi:hypothetical protein
MISKKTKIYKRWIDSKGNAVEDYKPFAKVETILKTTYSFIGIPIFVTREIIHRQR